MYSPRIFEEENQSTLRDFMRARPLATLVTVSDTGGLCADHLPLLVVEAAQKITLQGHVARANPLWRSIEVCPDILAIFHDPGRYISPGWYATKAQSGRVVPTWNYMAVHVSGRAYTRHDPAWLHGFLTRLTDVFEATQPSPWAMSDAPRDYIDAQLAAVVGIEIHVASITGKWKMSQNRQPEDIDGVIKGLDATGDPAAAVMAAEIERTRRR